jgi:dihydrodipicolinate synthase/N-acetylneuraminate lyase
VPLTTPFDVATGEIAPVHLRDNARALLRDGVAGLVAAGSTGEAPLLSPEEFRQLVAWLRDVVPDDRWLMAGAGRESTRATVAACQAAADEGADAVLVRPPSYYSPAITPAALVTHFGRVAEASPVPIFLYNIPKYTNLPLSDALLARLADHENIWGAKDSSGDLKNFAAYRAAAPHWTLLVGSGALYYAALELGGVGAIAAVGCFAATATVEIGRFFAAGDRARAGAAQERVAPLHRHIVSQRGVAGVKAAMDIVGLAGGPVRPPLADLSAQERKRVEGLLREAELLAA